MDTEVSAVPRSATCPSSSNQRTAGSPYTRGVWRTHPQCRGVRPLNTHGGPPLSPSQCKGCWAGILLHPTCNYSLTDTLPRLHSLYSINGASYIGQQNTKQKHFPLKSLQLLYQSLSVYLSSVSRIFRTSTSSCSSCASAHTPLMLTAGTDVALGKKLCPCPPNRPLSWSQLSSWNVDL